MRHAHMAATGAAQHGRGCTYPLARWGDPGREGTRACCWMGAGSGCRAGAGTPSRADSGDVYIKVCAMLKFHAETGNASDPEGEGTSNMGRAILGRGWLRGMCGQDRWDGYVHENASTAGENNELAELCTQVLSVSLTRLSCAGWLQTAQPTLLVNTCPVVGDDAVLHYEDEDRSRWSSR
ncbi:hypothetical protein BD413DRAFT_140343 [Trametes elegans]|nr:hypothetical protein BD413DRAFT_140343 [Trametes elegans]